MGLYWEYIGLNREALNSLLSPQSILQPSTNRATATRRQSLFKLNPLANRSHCQGDVGAANLASGVGLWV